MSGVANGSRRDELIRWIEEGLRDDKGCLNQDWMKYLHSSYVTRYQADSDRTWSTATWLVALAWTLFPAAVALNQRLSPPVVIIYAVTSVALVLLWLAIASTHRVWASRSYDMVRAIERSTLRSANDDKIRQELKKQHQTPSLLGGDPMGLVRWLIVAGTVAGWTYLWFAVSTGTFPPPELPATPSPAG
jgi:hypothetical protein